MRLWLVCGLAEMLTCAAVRTVGPGDGEEVLALYGSDLSLPAALRQASMADAALFGPWSRVIDLTAPGGATGLDGLKPEVVLTHLNGSAEFALVERFPGARLELFDNGLVTHLDRPVTSRPPPLTGRQTPKALVDRIARAWLGLEGILPRPNWLADTPCTAIPPEALRGAARAALERAGPEAVDPGDGVPARLVLGTAFHRVGRIRYAEERELHQRLVEALWREDGAPILYKEHPRSGSAPLLDESDGVIPIRSRLPVELWAEARPIREAYSLSSTALLTLAHVYGVDSRAIGVHIGFDPPLPQVDLLRAHLPAWPESHAA